MSARKAEDRFKAWPLRGSAGVVVLSLIALALGGCASERKNEKRKEDASNYNTQLGIDYMNQGDIPLAKEKLDRALKENPNNPKVHTARATLFEHMHLPAQAESEFQIALRLAPQDPDVSNNYAVYLCEIGKDDQGVKRFEAVARNALYRTPWIAYTNAGVCSHAAKHDDVAIAAFKEALQARPNFPEAAFQLASLQFTNGDVAGARNVIDTYLGSFDETPDLLLLGVRVAKAQNDRVAFVLYSRKLRLDFPSSDQAKALAEIEHNPG
jgi:type IV pilus assembly protein PilF